MGKNVWMLAVAVTVVVLVVVWLIWDRARAESEPIRIGAVLPLSGRSAPLGRGQRCALELAQEKINAEGGIRGRTLEFIFEDSQGKGTVGAAAARKLIDRHRVRILFTFPCEVVYAVQPVTDKAGVLLMAFAMDPRICRASPLTFQVFPNLAQQTDVLLQHLERSEPGRAAVIYMDAAAPGYAVPTLLVPGLKARGWNVAAVIPLKRKDADLKPQVAKLKASNPDLVITFTSPAFIPPILRNLQQQGLLGKVKILGGPGYTFPLKVAPEMLEGVEFVAPTYALRDSKREPLGSFEKQYKERCGRVPPFGSAFFFDGAMLVAEALKQKGDAISGVRQYLTTVKDYRGVSGSISIDDSGDTTVDMAMGLFRSGKITRVQEKGD